LPVEILKQPQYKPIPVEKQIVLIYCGTNGFLDAYPEAALQKFEEELFLFLDRESPGLFKEIAEKKSLDAELEKKIKGLLETFKGKFKAE
jgi:F-type H+/Na+-transporting ATPase subunit alpha